LDEDSVSRAAFDLVFAFDEVVTQHGHKEAVTVQQVKQNCEMESHEEKLHRMIIQSKISDTKDLMRRKAQEIGDRQRAEAAGGGAGAHGVGRYGAGGPGMGMGGPGGMGGMGGMGGPGGPGGPGMGGPSMMPTAGSLGVGGGGGGASAGGYGGGGGAGAGAPRAKGMQLGRKAGAGSSILESLAKEEGVSAAELGAGGAGAAGAGAAGGGAAAALAGAGGRPGGFGGAPSSDPVSLSVEERLTVTLGRQGGVESAEVNGTLTLALSADAPPESAHLRLAVDTSAGAAQGFQFKTHPNIDKQAFASESALQLKDPSRPFPTGSELGVLKWRRQAARGAADADALAPLSVTCWPSVSGTETYVNLEYESSAPFDLRELTIAVPVPGAVAGAPQVNQCDGAWRYDARARALLWTIALVDETNKSGSLEFVMQSTDADALFPIEASFGAGKTLCPVEVQGVVNAESGKAVKFALRRGLATEGYHVA
jgi:hypothetical protein